MCVKGKGGGLIKQAVMEILCCVLTFTSTCRLCIYPLATQGRTWRVKKFKGQRYNKLCNKMPKGN